MARAMLYKVRRYRGDGRWEWLQTTVETPDGDWSLGWSQLEMDGLAMKYEDAVTWRARARLTTSPDVISHAILPCL